jgi:Holliday junction resolvase RusA-like endonuclease
MRFVIEGNPGEAKSNTRLKAIRVGRGARLVSGRDCKAWERFAVASIRSQARGWKIADGSVTVVVTAYWPRQHRQGPALGLAFGDVDAVLKSPLDVLQTAGVLGDDAQVVSIVGLKAVDAERPRVEILVASGVLGLKGHLAELAEARS